MVHAQTCVYDHANTYFVVAGSGTEVVEGEIIAQCWPREEIVRNTLGLDAITPYLMERV